MSNITEFYKNTKASKNKKDSENHLINNLTKTPKKEKVYPSLSKGVKEFEKYGQIYDPFLEND